MSNMKNPLSRALFCALALFSLGLAALPAAAGTTPVQVTDQAGVSDADIDKLVSTLQDDQKRQALIKQLQTLSAAQKGTEPAAPPTPSDFLSVVTDHLQSIGSDMVDATTVLVAAPNLMGWFNRQVHDADTLASWEEVGRNVGMILAAAILADLITRQIAKAAYMRAVRRVPTTWVGRISMLVLAILLAAVPFCAFLVAADLAAEYLQPKLSTRRVLIVLIHAWVYARLIIVTSWALLLAPRTSGWALVPVGEETANYLFIWVRRFTQVAFYGFALIPAFWWLGAPGAVSAIVQKLVALLLTVLGILFVLQNRQAVAQWVRPRPRPVADPEAAADASAMHDTASEAPQPRVSGTIEVVRHRIAEVWHVLAIVYMITIFAVYALKIEGGFIFVFRATALTVAILIGVRLFGRGIRRLTERGFAIPTDLHDRFPTLEARANRYVPVLNVGAIFVLWAFAALGLLEAWGFKSFAWLSSAAGRQLTGSAITIVVILAVAFGCWEIFNAAIDRYLAGIDSHGQRISRSARVRTLLPFARNAVWISLLLVVVLLVLSELGINIAPLLAGAGVVGLAIGFGSQALVKDIITGLFMLVEDTIAVGEIVDLGGGNTGVIEAISIRTIKLRDNAGSVHTIPYSTVTQVRNLTKDFAYHVIDLTVAYGSDPEQVIALLKTVYEDMKKDPAFGPFMLAEIEVFGLNGFAPNSMNFQGRIKTLPMKQWAIGREYSRRLKRALDDAKVYLPGMVPGGTQVIDFADRAAEVLGKLQFAAPQQAAAEPDKDAPPPKLVPRKADASPA
jgi:small-conductance mechanosensitive channel